MCSLSQPHQLPFRAFISYSFDLSLYLIFVKAMGIHCSKFSSVNIKRALLSR